MKIAIVTGASSGMGREFVKQIGFLYRSLDGLWVIARRKERLIELQTHSVVPLRIFEGDLLRPPIYTSLKQAFEEDAGHSDAGECGRVWKNRFCRRDFSGG